MRPAVLRTRARLALAVCASLLASPLLAQGVPVIDGTNLAKNIEQLQAALRDAENQIAQIEELKKQVETGLEQLTNLEGILGSISGLNEIASLYNSVEDLRSRAAKITDLSGFQDALTIGDFDGLLDSLLDGDVTMGDKMAAEYMRDTLEGAGLTSETLAGLSSSENPQDKLIATTAATSATAMGVAQLSYEEAAQSLARIDGLVDEIANQDTPEGKHRPQHPDGRRDQLHARPDVAAERGCGARCRADGRELGRRTGQGKELLRLLGGRMMRRASHQVAAVVALVCLANFAAAEDLASFSDVQLARKNPGSGSGAGCGGRAGPPDRNAAARDRDLCRPQTGLPAKR